MVRSPTFPSDIDPEDTPQARAKAAARKAAKAAAIAETYSQGARAAVAEVVASPDPKSGDDLKLRELVQAVAEAGDFKKPQTKAVIEATLNVLGEALAAGRDINLPGLGKAKVKRSKLANGRRVSELRLRQDLPSPSAHDPRTDRVAEDDEEG